jgi:hypothetical protein
MAAMMQAAIVAWHIGRIAGRVVLRDAHGLLAVMIRAKIRRFHYTSERKRSDDQGYDEQKSHKGSIA